MFICCAAVAADESQTSSAWQDVSPGPWGHVRYSRIHISPPSEFIQSFLYESQETRWYVMVSAKEQVQNWLSAQGLAAPDIKLLLADGKPTDDQRGWILFPSTNLVLSLSSDMRGQLYTALGQWSENHRCRGPFRQADDEGGWRKIKFLPPEAMQCFQSLTYRRGGMKLFADLPLVLAALRDRPQDRIRFLRELCSESTVLATLRVLPGDDADALTRYWGVGGREEVVRSLIEAAADADNEMGMPIPLLLPGFARRVLYSYPDSNEQRFLDCHYSSMNFFSDKPDERMVQGNYRNTYFNAFYEEVPVADQLGDILVYLNESGDVVHSCVFVAGELVFTKNGGQHTQPWLLMTRNDVADFFSVEGPLTTKVYRRKAVDDEPPGR